MAKRITIYKGKNSQVIWEVDLPSMELKGWSSQKATKKAKPVEITETVEVIENGDI